VAVRGQSIYLLLVEGEQVRVSALDAQTGNVKWQSNLESIGYLAADDERVYCLAAVGHGMTELVALDAASGAIRWRFMQEDRTRPVSPARPVVMPDGRVCWTTNSTVHMLKAATGEAAWSRPIPQEGLLSAAVATADGIYIASNSGLYCLSPKYGDIVWRQGLGGEYSRLGRPAIQVAAGRVFAAMRKRDGRGQVICLDTTGHKLAWSEAIPQVLQLQVADGRLYIRGQGVQALDLESGEQLWSCKANGCGPVTATGGVVYFVDTTGPGRLVAVDSRNGQAVWDMAGIQSCEAFLPENGVGYFKTSDGVLRAMVLASR
jgi:outer membrane protein assembly factor BamB